MSAYRPKRSIPSAVNAPTAVRVESSQAINKLEAENILSDFISVSEAIAGSLPSSLDSSQITFSNTGLSSESGSSAILSQLKRVQRDLRGLPPLLSEVVDSTSGTIGTTEGVNKKIKFDDADADVSEEPKNKKIKFDDDSEMNPVIAEAASDNEPEEKEEKDDEEEENEENEDEEEKPDKESKKSKKEKQDKKDKKEKKEKKHKKDKKDKKDKKKESKE